MPLTKKKYGPLTLVKSKLETRVYTFEFNSKVMTC